MLSIKLFIFFIISSFWNNQAQCSGINLPMPGQYTQKTIIGNLIDKPIASPVNAPTDHHNNSDNNPIILSQYNRQDKNYYLTHGHKEEYTSQFNLIPAHEELLAESRKFIGISIVTELVPLKMDNPKILAEKRAQIRRELELESIETKKQCEEIKLLIALSIPIINDPQKKFLENLINDPTSCNQFSDKKNTLNRETFLYKKSNSQNQKNLDSKSTQSNNIVRLDDVIDDNVQYKQYVFVDNNGEYSTGYLESYDGKSGTLFKFMKSQAIQPSKALQQMQQFNAYHEKSILQMKINCLKNSPVVQRQQVDALFNAKYINREQAIQYYQQIEYAQELSQAAAAVKKFEKTGGLHAVQKSSDTVTPQTTNPKSSQQPIKNQVSSISTVLEEPNSTPIKNSNRSDNLTPGPTKTDQTISTEEMALLAHVTHKNTPNFKNLSLPPCDDEDVKIQNHQHQLLTAQDRWIQKNDMSKSNSQEMAMVQHFLNVIVKAQNDTTIEIAQSGLKAWEQAQNAATESLKKHYLKKVIMYYDAIQYKAPKQSIAQHAQSMKSFELDNLLQDYKAAIKMHGDEQRLNAYKKKLPLLNRLENRIKSLDESKKQLQIFKALPLRNYTLSPQARQFMMENNINYATFDNSVHFTDFQDCLTQEILEIIESSAQMAQIYDAQSIIGKIIHDNCNLAVSAQQLNQSSNIKEATAIVDFSHFFDAYAQVLHNSKLYHPSAVDVHVGIMEGTVRAASAWKNFITNSIYEPSQTLKKIVDDCKAIAASLSKIVKVGHEFMPDAYLNDMMEDMQEKFKIIQNNKSTGNFNDISKMTQRTQRNAQYLQNGFYGTLEVSQFMFEEMMKKSLRQNVAIGTEIIVDNMIASKATEYLLKLSSIVCNEAAGFIDQINHNLPAHLENTPVHFVETSTGELCAFAENSGENIGAAMATQFAAHNAEQIIQNGVKAKTLSDKIKDLTKPDPILVDKFEENIKPFLRQDKLVDVERLKAIEGVDQIEKFRDYTKNFHPDEIAKLKPEEILYLNLCDWLAPQAKAINAEITAMGGLKVIDPVTKKVEAIIHEFDFFHSLLGEMKPGNLKECLKGGHLMISDLRAATLEIGEIKTFGDGFFDIFIQVKSNRKNNSYFPMGTTVAESFAMIKEGIQNSKNIIINTVDQKTFIDIETKKEQYSRFIIENNKTKFHPLHPSLFSKK